MNIDHGEWPCCTFAMRPTDEFFLQIRSLLDHREQPGARALRLTGSPALSRCSRTVWQVATQPCRWARPPSRAEPTSSGSNSFTLLISHPAELTRGTNDGIEA